MLPLVAVPTSSGYWGILQSPEIRSFGMSSGVGVVADKHREGEG